MTKYVLLSKYNELTAIERSDVPEAPALVEHGRLHAVHLRAVTLDGVGVVEAEGVLELVVHLRDPAVIVGASVFGQTLDLVLKLLQTWQKIEKRGRHELDHGQG